MCVCIVCISTLVVCMTILMDKTNCTSHERMAREKWLVSCCLCLVWFVHAFSLVVFLLYVRRSAAVFVAAASSGVRWWCLLLMNWTKESGVRYGSYCCIFNLFFFSSSFVVYRRGWFFIWKGRKSEKLSRQMWLNRFDM